MKNSTTRQNRPIHRAAWLMLAVAPVAAIFSATPALAAADTWAPNASPNSEWMTASNWAAGVAPTPGADSLVFAGSVGTASDNNFTSAVFNGITFATGASTFTLTGSALHLGFAEIAPTLTASSGDLTNNSSNTQNINLALTLDAGVHIISNTSTGQLNFAGAITQSKGSVAIFQPGAANINTTGSGLANDATGILGGWATFGGTNSVPGGYASLDVSGNVVAFNNYTTVAGNATLPDDATKNLSIVSNATGQATAILPGPLTHLNTILFASNPNNLVAQSIPVTAGNTLVLGQNGGIMNATGTGDNILRNITVGGTSSPLSGILTAGNGTAPANITFSAGSLANVSGILTVNAQIDDNNLATPATPAAVSVTIDGGYVTMNGTASNYSGGTYVLSGRISTTPTGALGTGPVFIYAGAQMNSTGTFANNFFIAGNGSLEQPAVGLGALRLFGTGAAAGHLSGTVTLMGDAEITATNTSVPLITGQITGTGNLTLNRTNGSQQGGVINIGSNTAAIPLPNNYTGDTILGAPSAGTGNGGLTIIAPLTIGQNDNIMPHGLTGSFSGGTTGNVIFDSTASGHNAIFDLNGTTQTLNGLSSTNTNVSGDIITSSGGGTGNVATLVVGDSNANGNYTGTIQDGGGQLAFRKIGSGTQVLSGSNSYTGDTNINGGTLVSPTGLSSSGNVNINTASASTSFIAAGSAGNITLAANNGANKASFSPGTSTNAGSIASLNASSLTVNGGNLNFDLSSTPGVGDAVTVNGLINFNAASSIIPHGGSTGSYTVLTSFGGPIVYTVAPTIVSSGDPLVRPTTYTLDALSNPSALTINVVGGPHSLTWSGAANSTWSINATATKNFASPSADVFFNQDTVAFSDGGANRTITISGSVQPASVTVNSNAGTDYTFSGGTIDGVTSLSKSNGGNLTLTSNNTYSGGTNIDAGTVTVGNNTSAGSLGSGNVTFTNAANLVLSRTDAVSLANIISGPGNVTIGQAGGTSNVTLTAVNGYSGPTTVNTGSTLVVGPLGSIAASSGVALNGSTEIINGANASANFGDSLTVGASGGTIKYANFANLNAFGTNNVAITTTAGGTLTVDLNDPEASIKTFGFASTITGAGDLVFTDSLGNPSNGAGAFDSLTSSVTFAGDTGNLTVSNAFRLTTPGIPAGNATVVNGAQLSISAAGTFANNFFLSGAGASTDIPSLGALRLSSGSTITGNISLTSNALITAGTAAGNTAVLNGKISGPGALSLASGTFTLANLTASPNSYGPTNAGSIATIIGNAAGRAATVTLNDTNSISHNGLQLQGGNLLINGFDIAFSNLSSIVGPGNPLIGGNITNAGATTNTLSFGSDNSSQSFAGVIGDGSSGGFLNVTKNGTGIETISGNQTYSGTTTINAGGGLAFTATGSLSAVTPVIANGSLSFAGPTQSLASLNGNGAISLNTTALTINGNGSGGPVTDNGTNASITIAGTSPSLKSVNVATLTINAGSTLAITANIPSPGLSKLTALSIPGSYGGSASAASAWTGGLDLTNSKLIVEDSSPNRPADLAQLINETLASNTTGNVGIFSSTANAANIAAGKIVKVVAVSDNTVRLATFPGGSSSNFGGTNNVDANSILIAAVFKGDANMDGVVDIQDLTDVANHWQQSVTDWSQGDFDGSNFVDIQDLTSVANNWQAGVGAGGGQSFSDALAQIGGFKPAIPTPEPASLALLTLGGLLLTNRRRNKH